MKIFFGIVHFHGWEVDILKNIYLIVGPSGSGKTTLAEALARDYGLKTVWSYTTRPKRYPEEEGHFFVTNEEFNNLGELCAYTEYNGFRYGVTSDVIDQSDIYVIDPPGVCYMMEHYKGPKRIVTIGLEISETVRALRMMKRGDTIPDILRRIEVDAEWFNPKKLGFVYGTTISALNADEMEAQVWDYICHLENLTEETL